MLCCKHCIVKYKKRNKKLKRKGLTSHWLGLVDAQDCLDSCALSEPGVSDPKRVKFLTNKLLQLCIRLPD